MSSVITGGDKIAAVTGGVFSLETVTAAGVKTDVLLVTPAEVMAAYIIDGLGSMARPSEGGSWPLYISHMPDGDNVASDAGSIYNTPGVKDGRRMEGPISQHYGIQLRIRSLEQSDGWAKAEDIASNLDAVHNVTVTNGAEEYQLRNISRQGPVVPLGIEQESTRRRFLFTVNFLVTMERIV